MSKILRLLFLYITFQILILFLYFSLFHNIPPSTTKEYLRDHPDFLIQPSYLSSCSFKKHSISDAIEKLKIDFSSCAVVGSSELLLQGGYGEQINSHTAVFRSNLPATRALYHKDVGNYTTVNVMFRGLQTVGLKPNSLTIYSGDPVYYWDVVHERMCDREDFFIFFTTNTFFEFLRSLLRPNDNSLNEPSTGFRAIGIALQLCDSVTIYGYDWYNIQSKYYQTFPGIKLNIQNQDNSRHNWIAEQEVIDYMIRNHIIDAHNCLLHT
eukprot:TRINITY_DN10023_c0_g1_i1.p1 TRINITY_DN10023_c0_g1~~TRINITY_DN10023_c0_g1_i1.p1  ORF type:complete len:267 (+),score=23.80 TRINITY_DN10023_c0_g1_i1:138-938(+)